jgi:hypothetical protein
VQDVMIAVKNSNDSNFIVFIAYKS